MRPVINGGFGRDVLLGGPGNDGLSGGFGDVLEPACRNESATSPVSGRGGPWTGRAVFTYG